MGYAVANTHPSGYRLVAILALASDTFATVKKVALGGLFFLSMSSLSICSEFWYRQPQLLGNQVVKNHHPLCFYSNAFGDLLFG